MQQGVIASCISLVNLNTPINDAATQLAKLVRAEMEETVILITGTPPIQ